jgi:hypothetical protein
MICLIGSAGWALYAWYFAFVHYGPAAIWTWVKTPLLLSALLLPLLLMFLTRWNNLSQVLVRTHTRGLQIQHKQKKSRIPWTAVKELYTSATKYGINGFVWKKKAGIRLVFHSSKREVNLDADLDNFENLLQSIKTYIYPRIGAEVDSLLASGKPVEFGPVQVSRRSINISRKDIPWEAVDTCLLKNGKLILTTMQNNREHSIKLRSAHIPNLDICYEIIRKMSGA